MEITKALDSLNSHDMDPPMKIKMLIQLIFFDTIKMYC